MSQGAQPYRDFNRPNLDKGGSEPPNKVGAHEALNSPASSSPTFEAPSMPSSSQALAPNLIGWKLSGVTQTGVNPKVHFSKDGQYAASTSADSLVLLGLSKDEVPEIRFDSGDPVLKGLRIGNGGFSQDSKYFHLLIAGQPGKLLRLHIPSLLQGADPRSIAQYPEFPSASGRHIFSPSGDFFLTYAASGYKMAVPRQLNPISDRILINSGEPFAISGTPAIESIDDQGIKVAIGTLPDGEPHSVLMVRDLVTRQEYRTAHNAELTALSFGHADNKLWCGDKDGWITGYQIENGENLNSGELWMISRCPVIGASITAILALPESEELIIGDSGGGIYRANLLGIENERGLEQIGTLESGHLTSISFCRATSTLGLGLSTGGLASYQR